MLFLLFLLFRGRGRGVRSTFGASAVFGGRVSFSLPPPSRHLKSLFPFFFPPPPARCSPRNEKTRNLRSEMETMKTTARGTWRRGASSSRRREGASPTSKANGGIFARGRYALAWGGRFTGKFWRCCARRGSSKRRGGYKEYIYIYSNSTNCTHYLLPQTKGVGCRREAISIAVPGNTRHCRLLDAAGLLDPSLRAMQFLSG